MAIRRVENHEHKSSLGKGIVSATVGAGLGYVSKYVLPLTSQEKDADYQAIINNIKHQATKLENEFLESIKLNPQRSLAQDAYIKSSKNFVKQNTKSYNFALKTIRPTAPFVVAGGITGLMVSFIKNVFN